MEMKSSGKIVSFAKWNFSQSTVEKHFGMEGDFNAR